MKITSDFAILDVKKGRKKLLKRFESRPRMGPCPAELKLPVTITGYIVGVWGDDDGISREFEVEVTEVDCET